MNLTTDQALDEAAKQITLNVMDAIKAFTSGKGALEIADIKDPDGSNVRTIRLKIDDATTPGQS